MPGLSMVFDILAVDRASQVFDKVGGRAAAAGREVEASSSKMSKAVSAVGVGIGVAAAAFAVHSVKMASQFDANMLLIQTQAGATSSEVKKMIPAVLALAGQTAQAPEALATSMYHAYSVTQDMAKALDITRSAAKLATISHSDLEQTTNALTAAVASNIPGIGNMNDAIAMLNATVGAGDMKMTDLNEAMGSGLLTVVKGYGLGMRDVSASLAVLGDNNIRGANAATMLRMAVQAMAVPVKAGDAVLKALGVTTGQTDQALAKYGITGKKLASDMQTGGLNKAITDLRDHLQAAGVKSDQVGEIITTAFGKKAGPGVAVLLSQFDRLQQKYGAVDAATHSFGAEWDATTKTTKFQMDALGQSVNAMAISFGNALMPAVNGVLGWMNTTGVPGLQKFGSAVGDVFHWFSQLPGPIKAVAEALAGLALANAVGLFTKLGNGIVYARVLMAEFGATTSGSMATVTAAYRGAAAAAGELAAVQGSAGLRSAVSGIAGLGAAAGATAKVGFGALRSAGGSLVSMLGGPWVVGIAAAAGALMYFRNQIQQHNEQVKSATTDVKSWYDAMSSKGGSAAVDGMNNIRSKQLELASAQAKLNELQKNNVFISGRGGAQLGLSNVAIARQQQVVSDLNTELIKGKKAHDDWWQSLTPAQKITETLTADEATLANAIATTGTNSIATKNATADYNAALGKQKALSDQLASAEQTQIQKLQTLADVQLGAVSSSLAATQAQSQLNSGIADFRKGAADGTLKGQAFTDQSNALAQQAISTAQALAKQEHDQLAANHQTDDGTMANKIMLQSLKDSAAHLTGPGHDALVKAYNDLLKATGATGNMSESATNMGLNVIKTFNNNTAIIHGATDAQIKDLGALGYKVTHLPNGNIVVTSDTKMARATLDALINDYNNKVLRIDTSAGQHISSATGPGGTSTRMATGGLIHGPGTGTSDSIPIMASNKEFIVNAAATAANLPLLHAINDGTIRGFAGGGQITMHKAYAADLSAQAVRAAEATISQLAAQAAAMGSPGGAPANVSGNAAIMQRVASQYGWGSGAQWNALYGVEMREAGFNNRAQNPTSTAYGMPQFLDSTWATVGISKTSDPLFQSVGMMRYIAQRYGDPLGAYRHEQNFGWYKDGTNYVPNDGPAYLHKGEAVVPASKNQGAPYQSGPMEITGTLRFDADGLVHIVDGRIVEFATAQSHRGTYNP